MSRDTAQEHLDAGRPVDALKYLASALRNDPTNSTLFDQSSRALFVAIDQPEALATWDIQDRSEFYRRLLHHSPCPTPMLTLAHEAASNLSSGNRDAVTRLVEELQPVLADLMDRATTDTDTFKNVLVFLLTTRVVAGPWLSQSELSRLHLTWFERFTPEDLALPYSVMFNKDLYEQNRADILSSYLPDTQTVKIDHLPPDTVLFLHWLAGRDLFEDAPALWTYLDRHLPGSERDQAASKALLLRSATVPTDAKLKKWGVDSCTPLLENYASGKEQRKFTKTQRVGARWLQNRPFQALNAALWTYAPALAGRRKPKVAICLSGQLRGYETALATWRTSILAGIDPVFFVHSWTGVGRSDAQPFRYVLPFEGQTFSDTYRRVGLSLGYEAMRARYPSLFKALATGNTVNAQSVKTAYDTDHVVLEDDAHDTFSTFSNQQKMHYKIHAADQMAQSHGGFDMHMRLRPDLAINLVGMNWNDLWAACKSRPVIFAEKPFGLHYDTLMIGDQCAISTPELMREYARTWTDYPDLAKSGLARFPDTFTGHSSLALTAWVRGISVERLPLRFGTLQDAAPLSNIDILTALQTDNRGDADDQSLLHAVQQDIKAR